jgi:hypothetical protein
MSNNTPSFDKKKMNAVKTAPNGVVNLETIFHFKEVDEVITAEYSGGRIKHGYLVGKVIEGKLAFQYSQLQDDGEKDSGHSVCDIIVLPDGRIQLVEHFVWSEGTGTNIIEEIS